MVRAAWLASSHATSACGIGSCPGSKLSTCLASAASRNESSSTCRLTVAITIAAVATATCPAVATPSGEHRIGHRQRCPLPCSCRTPPPSSGALKRRSLPMTVYRKFTPDEVNTIRQEYAAYVPVAEIASHVGHSVGTVRQKIIALGLIRDQRVTWAMLYAPPELVARRAEMTNDEFVAAAKAWRAGAHQRSLAEIRDKLDAIF